jgi:hypothetical protein
VAPSGPSQGSETPLPFCVSQAWEARELETYLATQHPFDLGSSGFAAATQAIGDHYDAIDSDLGKDPGSAVGMSQARRHHDDDRVN